MADRPILFQAPMVRALLAGTKTQTRRVLTKARLFATPEWKPLTLRGEPLARALQGASDFHHLDGDGWSWMADAFDWQAPATRTQWHAHIGFAPGDRLWVRETWAKVGDEEDDVHACPDLRVHAYYRADVVDPERQRWRPSIFMPRWASRLTLTVTGVRVQRLHDIDEADARAEGIVSEEHDDGRTIYPVPGTIDYCDTAVAAYRWLWDDINKPGAWAANPWVCATSFTVHRQNIDTMKEAA